MKAGNDASDWVLEVNASATKDVDEKNDSNGPRDEPVNKPSIKCKNLFRITQSLKNTW